MSPVSIVTCIVEVGASIGNTTVTLNAKKVLTVNGKETTLPFINNDFDVHEANEEFMQVISVLGSSVLVYRYSQVPNSVSISF